MEYKVENGKELYHVKWLGYPDSDNTWEPRECFPTPGEGIIAQMEEAKARYEDEHSPKYTLKSPSRKRREREPEPKRLKRTNDVAAHDSDDADYESSLQPCVVVLKVSRGSTGEHVCDFEVNGKKDQKLVSEVLDLHPKALCHFLLKRVRFRGPGESHH